MDILGPRWHRFLGGMHAGPPRQLGTSGDEAGTPFVSHVGPRPLDEHENPVAESNQEENVDEQPCQPRDEPGDAKFSKLRDGRSSTNRRQASFVPVFEILPSLP